MTIETNQTMPASQVPSSPWNTRITIKEVHEYSHCTILLLSQSTPTGNGETSWACKTSEIYW